MPKEVIRTGEFNTVIGWSEGTVQVAVEMRDPQDDAAPVTLADLVNDFDVDESNTIRGLYATANRDHLNTLIRVLRRARDSAYGRDE